MNTKTVKAKAVLNLIREYKPGLIAVETAHCGFVRPLKGDFQRALEVDPERILKIAIVVEAVKDEILGTVNRVTALGVGPSAESFDPSVFADGEE